MPTNDTQETLPLKTISDSGAVPKARLSDAQKAQSIYWNLHRANELRNLRGTTIQGMLDGNPPYKTSSLRQNAQGWRANFNTLEGKSRKDAAKVPYYDLFASPPLFADVITKRSSDKLSADTAGRIISEEFDTMLREWPGFDYNIWQMLDDFVAFGRGWLWFPQQENWQFKRISWWRVLHPDGTSVDTEDWEVFAIEHMFNPITLMSYIRDEESAKAAGWNPKRVREAIKKAVPAQPSHSQDEMMVQQAVRDEDIYLTTRNATVQAASIYVKEFDGSWSKILVETQREKDKLKPTDWLYYKQNVAEESVHELVAPFFFEVETGSINGLGGIGRDIFDIIKAKDRMRCEQVNNVFLRSTVLLQAQNASSNVKSGLVQVGGGVTVIPNGLAIQQSSVLGDIESTLVVNQDLDRMLDSNTGIYRPQFEKPAGNPETATAANIRFSQSTVLTNSAVNRFYQQLDLLYKEIYRRCSKAVPESNNPGLKAARAFQKRVKARGVSEAQLQNPFSVKAVRSIGNGSPAMRQQMTAEMFQVAPQFGQRGQENLMEDFISARGGQEKVDRYMPIEDREKLPTEQDRQALLENDSIKGGSPVIIVENDDHLVHLQRHFEAIFGAFQAVQEGAPPVESASFVQGMLPHVQEHIQLTGQPEAKKQFEQMFREASKQLNELLSAIQQSQPDPEATQQAMSDEQIKQFKAQSDVALKEQKQAATLDQRKRDHDFNEQIKTAETASDIQRKNALAASDIQISQAKAASDRRNESNSKPKAKAAD